MIMLTIGLFFMAFDMGGLSSGEWGGRLCVLKIELTRMDYYDSPV
jgi:hypothetical protein